MDGATLSPYPHYSWLAHWISIRPPRVFELHEEQHVTHRLLLTTAGDARITWTTNGNDVLFQSTDGDIGFYPCGSAAHVFAITATGGYQAYALLLPKNHLRDVFASDDLRPGRGLHAMPVFQDAVMRACLLRLARANERRLVSEEIGDEIAARQIVMRLCVIAGGGTPDWQKDTSVFTAVVMRQIVERVDTHLADHPSLEQMSRGFGLSPSHFARKFKKSAGVSLNRFVNRRRVGLALALLRSGNTPLAQLSLDLGFCSQSHFTRLFRGLTGITPFQFSQGWRPTGE
jgi:AraC-like DNA-binding protein